MPNDKNDKILLKILLGVAVWAVTMWGALRLNQLPVPTDLEHAICGPWGCGPRTMDLAAYHAFQVAFIAFPCILAICFVKTPTLQSVGRFLLATGGAVLLGLLIHEIVTEWSIHRQHFPQRYLYRIAISTDLPAIPFLLAGTVMLAWTRFRIGEQRVKSTVQR